MSTTNTVSNCLSLQQLADLSDRDEKIVFYQDFSRRLEVPKSDCENDLQLLVDMNISTILSTLLSDAASDDSVLKTAALRVVIICVRIDQILSKLTPIECSSIIKSILSVISSTADAHACRLALFFISQQQIAVDVVRLHLADIITAIQSCRCNFTSSPGIDAQSVAALDKLFSRLPTEMSSCAYQWYPLIYPYVIQTNAKVRESAISLIESSVSMVEKDSRISAALLVDLDKESGLRTEMIRLMETSQHSVALMGCRLYIRLLGKEFHKREVCQKFLTPLLEKGFTCIDNNVKLNAFACWNALIDNYALEPDIISNMKKVMLIMKLLLMPFRADAVEEQKIKTWWHFVCRLGDRPITVEQIILPFLEFSIHNISANDAKMAVSRAAPATMSAKFTSPPNKFVSTPGISASNGQSASIPTSASTPGGSTAAVSVTATRSLLTVCSCHKLISESLLLILSKGATSLDSITSAVQISLELLPVDLFTRVTYFAKHSVQIIGLVKTLMLSANEASSIALVATLTLTWRALISRVRAVLDFSDEALRSQKHDILTTLFETLHSVVISRPISFTSETMLELVTCVVDGLPMKIYSGRSSYHIAAKPSTQIMRGCPCLFIVQLLFHPSLISSSKQRDQLGNLVQQLVQYGTTDMTGALALNLFQEVLLLVGSACESLLGCSSLIAITNDCQLDQSRSSEDNDDGCVDRTETAVPPVVTEARIISDIGDVNINASEIRETFAIIWIRVSTQLHEHLRKTCEVNQGSSSEHDFVCLYVALMLPVIHLFNNSLSITTAKALLDSWVLMFDEFVRLSSMVPNAEANFVCEELCERIVTRFFNKSIQDERLLESLCVVAQSVTRNLDFSAIRTETSTFNFNVNSPSTLKRKSRRRPLANLHSLTKLTEMLLTSVLCMQPLDKSNARLQKIMQDVCLVIKSLFSYNAPSTVIMPTVLMLTGPLSKLYSESSGGDNNSFTQQSLTCFEELWSSIAEWIQNYYVGTYDTDLLRKMSPLWVATLGHSQMAIRDVTVSLWNFFIRRTLSLEYPQELLATLNKLKRQGKVTVPGWDPDTMDTTTEADMVLLEVASSKGRTARISTTSSYTAAQRVTSSPANPLVYFASPSKQKVTAINGSPSPSPAKQLGSFLNRPPPAPEIIKSPMKKPATPKRTRSARKDVQLREMRDDEFVPIEPVAKRRRINLTDHQREVLKERSILPTMYNNLDGNTQSLDYSQFPECSQIDGSMSVMLNAVAVPVDQNRLYIPAPQAVSVPNEDMLNNNKNATVGTDLFMRMTTNEDVYKANDVAGSTAVMVPPLQGTSDENKSETRACSVTAATTPHKGNFTDALLSNGKSTAFHADSSNSMISKDINISLENSGVSPAKCCPAACAMTDCTVRLEKLPVHELTSSPALRATSNSGISLQDSPPKDLQLSSKASDELSQNYQVITGAGDKSSAVKPIAARRNLYGAVNAPAVVIDKADCVPLSEAVEKISTGGCEQRRSTRSSVRNEFITGSPNHPQRICSKEADYLGVTNELTSTDAENVTSVDAAPSSGGACNSNSVLEIEAAAAENSPVAVDPSCSGPLESAGLLRRQTRSSLSGSIAGRFHEQSQNSKNSYTDLCVDDSDELITKTTTAGFAVLVEDSQISPARRVPQASVEILSSINKSENECFIVEDSQQPFVNKSIEQAATHLPVQPEDSSSITNHRGRKPKSNFFINTSNSSSDESRIDAETKNNTKRTEDNSSKRSSLRPRLSLQPKLPDLVCSSTEATATDKVGAPPSAPVVSQTVNIGRPVRSHHPPRFLDNMVTENILNVISKQCFNGKLSKDSLAKGTAEKQVRKTRRQSCPDSMKDRAMHKVGDSLSPIRQTMDTESVPGIFMEENEKESQPKVVDKKAMSSEVLPGEGEAFNRCGGSESDAACTLCIEIKDADVHTTTVNRNVTTEEAVSEHDRAIISHEVSSSATAECAITAEVFDAGANIGNVENDKVVATNESNACDDLGMIVTVDAASGITDVVSMNSVGTNAVHVAVDDTVERAAFNDNTAIHSDCAEKIANCCSADNVFSDSDSATTAVVDETANVALTVNVSAACDNASSRMCFSPSDDLPLSQLARMSHPTQSKHIKSSSANKILDLTGNDAEDNFNFSASTGNTCLDSPFQKEPFDSSTLLRVNSPEALEHHDYSRSPDEKCLERKEEQKNVCEHEERKGRRGIRVKRRSRGGKIDYSGMEMARCDVLTNDNCVYESNNCPASICAVSSLEDGDEIMTEIVVSSNSSLSSEGADVCESNKVKDILILNENSNAAIATSMADFETAECNDLRSSTVPKCAGTLKCTDRKTVHVMATDTLVLPGVSDNCSTAAETNAASMDIDAELPKLIKIPNWDGATSKSLNSVLHPGLPSCISGLVDDNLEKGPAFRNTPLATPNTVTSENDVSGSSSMSRAIVKITPVSGIDRILDIPETPTSANKHRGPEHRATALSRGQRILQLTSQQQLNRSGDSTRGAIYGVTTEPRSDGENSPVKNLGSPAISTVSSTGPRSSGHGPSSPNMFANLVFSPASSPSAGILRKRLRATGDSGAAFSAGGGGDHLGVPSPIGRKRVCFAEVVQTHEIPNRHQVACKSTAKSSRTHTFSQPSIDELSTVLYQTGDEQQLDSLPSDSCNVQPVNILNSVSSVEHKKNLAGSSQESLSDPTVEHTDAATSSDSLNKDDTAVSQHESNQLSTAAGVVELTGDIITASGYTDDTMMQDCIVSSLNDNCELQITPSNGTDIGVSNLEASSSAISERASLKEIFEQMKERIDRLWPSLSREEREQAFRSSSEVALLVSGKLFSTPL